MTVPRGLPPTADERLTTVLRRMLPGAAGGQTRHISPTGRPNDRAPQYFPPPAGAYLPLRTRHWSYTFGATTEINFSDEILANNFAGAGAAFYTYTPSPTPGSARLLLPGPGLYAMGGNFYGTTTSASPFVDFATLAFGDNMSLPLSIPVGMGTDGSSYLGNWSVVKVITGGSLRVTVSRTAGDSMTSADIWVTQIG